MNGQKSQLSPRNGGKLVVLVVARISGGPTQKEQSLADQADHGRAVIEELYPGPVNYIVVATTGKGERIDRPELDEVRAHLRSGKIDVLFAEDAGRIVRGTAAKDIACLAVDHKVRILIPNDDIDSDDPNWETDMIDACKQHVGANESTSKRLKKKLMNRFMKGLGAIPRETSGESGELTQLGLAFGRSALVWNIRRRRGDGVWPRRRARGGVRRPVWRRVGRAGR